MGLFHRGTLGDKLLPDGRLAVIYPLTFGRARICVGPAGVEWYDDSW
jgi:hypothetical protein